MHWTEILAIIILAAAAWPILFLIGVPVVEWLIERVTGRFVGGFLHRTPRLWFWLLAPILILFVVCLPLLIQVKSPGRLLLVGWVWATVLLFGLFLYDTNRHKWAMRAVAGSIFGLYVWYVCFMFITDNDPLRIPDRKGGASLVNAVMGLIVIGLPGLWYMLTGRGTFREYIPHEEESDEGDWNVEEQFSQPDENSYNDVP